jgi:3-phenylpropionate/trans-cinnamate dioxygenase ferredoxin reductase subunit
VGYLRTMRDAVALASRLQERPRVVVVGAGFIGAEVAASARMLGCEVVVLEVLDVPLLRVLGEELGNVYAQIHVDHGVDLRLGEGIDGVRGAGRVEAVIGTSGRLYPADLVVIGVGIVPNVELAAEAGIECDNGIVVDGACRTSMPGVFAAGDVANRPDPWTGHRIRVEHFQNAQNQGAAAGRAMLGREVDFGEVPWFWTDQYDVNLQILGHPDPAGERVVRGSLEARDLIAFYLRGTSVTAAIALNRGKDVAATRRLIERGVEIDAGQLADDDVALRDLLKG